MRTLTFILLEIELSAREREACLVALSFLLGSQILMRLIVPVGQGHQQNSYAMLCFRQVKVITYQASRAMKHMVSVEHTRAGSLR